MKTADCPCPPDTMVCKNVAKKVLLVLCLSSLAVGLVTAQPNADLNTCKDACEAMGHVTAQPNLDVKACKDTCEAMGLVSAQPNADVKACKDTCEVESNTDLKACRDACEAM
eukprot:TRINITY_DN13696_c0_g1_i1.p1 TRINITY_DN13696_c0_g1~~TRINITY_DN13696_c0_g1_i1.p1  ORF type:complete len:112 (+),score=27.34 TRINITY_DN13696_c0_g1_i1:52-387(+)